METDRSPNTPGSEKEKDKNSSAQKIQKYLIFSKQSFHFIFLSAWRSHTNKKIYKYYRDIIFFKSKFGLFLNSLHLIITKRGNPSQLLKAINPSESFLLDSASNVHVRFRLGGEVFPPNIYYKIFLHGPLCDVNSFAPRDYSMIYRGIFIEIMSETWVDAGDKTKKMSYQEYLQSQHKYTNNGWYLRTDNNGWRPVSHYSENEEYYNIDFP